MALLWGLMITSGVQYMKINDGARNTLLTLGRHLQTASVQAEGWRDGMLGAFGLKKYGITNRKRLLTRCLACIIFSLFPDTR